MKRGCNPDPVAEQAVRATHDRIRQLQADIDALVGVRWRALAAMKDGGYTNTDLGRVLGVTRARVHQLATAYESRKEVSADRT